MKKCTRCKEIKTLDTFSKDASRFGGYSSKCRPCCLNYSRSESAKLSNFKSYIKTQYGITVDEYNQMFTNQQGKCYICERHQSEFDIRLAVDHNHITMKVRGLLCSRCNHGLGHLKADNGTDLFFKAIQYLLDTDGK